MKPLFTKEEFVDNVFKAARQDKADKISECHAEYVNAKIEKWLAEAPVVYAYNDEPPILGTFWCFELASQLGAKPTHKARLVCIEEIKK